MERVEIVFQGMLPPTPILIMPICPETFTIIIYRSYFIAFGAEYFPIVIIVYLSQIVFLKWKIMTCKSVDLEPSLAYIVYLPTFRAKVETIPTLMAHNAVD